MKNLTTSILLALPILVVSPTVMAASASASADAVAKAVDVQFKKGASSANYYGKLKGNKYDSYTFYAKKNQKLSVKIAGGNVDTYLFHKNLANSVNVGEYAPEVDDKGYYTLPYSGEYELRVLQPRSQASRGKKPVYWLEISIL
ncbi:pre-peptidase C-terminal domain-containing protein [Psychrobacter aquimaris]|uniref:pre-peptidase C-terminal domain-containing protein n=1 Tax=Psychrobacter aquimaris TaxID=292733 RepID=UPI003FD64B37